jgi:hypothetical protein
MGLLDFFADRSEAYIKRTGSDYQEKRGPFGEVQIKGQFAEYTQKANKNGGIFNLFKSGSDDTPQLQGKKDQKRLK